MSWQVRHEGSPNATTLPAPQKVLEGIAEGVWEISDEVRGPGETAWKSIEAHPAFVEALADYEPPKPKVHPDETHLDMNPLIDVALVLLIFFILTTSYDALRAVMTMPQVTQKDKKATPIVLAPDAKATLVRVKARMSPDGKSVVYTVDDSEIPEKNLWEAIAVGVSQGRNKLVIDAQDVTWGSVVKIIDAGKKARVEKYMFRVNAPEK
jgi:biopolymer transport protein ExbD